MLMGKRITSMLYMLLYAIFYSLLVVFVKYVPQYSLFSKLFFRYLFPCVIFVLAFSKNKKLFCGKCEDRKFLIMRSIICNVAIFLIFYAMSLLAPADSTALYLTFPIFASILGVIWLKEKLSFYKSISYLFSFLGVLFIFRPNIEIDHYPFLVGLSSAFLFALSYVLIGYSNKGRDIDSFAFLFYLSFVGLFMLLPWVFVWTINATSIKDILWLVLIGALATGAQLFSTMAYKIGDSSQVSVFSYFGLIFSMIFSIPILGIYPDIYSYLGAMFVLLGGIVIYLEGRRHSKVG
ncbi:DMT family transporter [Candidatus Borreliella tachyglossi]|uniref:DMT family transporter n=1 Tax=Candidatus Borreliella tachyglossi TaxID=1964448 RepID=UPI004041F131